MRKILKVYNGLDDLLMDGVKRSFSREGLKLSLFLFVPLAVLFGALALNIYVNAYVGIAISSIMSAFLLPFIIYLIAKKAPVYVSKSELKKSKK